MLAGHREGLSEFVRGHVHGHGSVGEGPGARGILCWGVSDCGLPCLCVGLVCVWVIGVWGCCARRVPYMWRRWCVRRQVCVAALVCVLMCLWGPIYVGVLAWRGLVCGTLPCVPGVGRGSTGAVSLCVSGVPGTCEYCMQRSGVLCEGIGLRGARVWRGVPGARGVPRPWPATGSTPPPRPHLPHLPPPTRRPGEKSRPRRRADPFPSD